MHQDQLEQHAADRLTQLDQRLGHGPLLRTDDEVTDRAVRALRRRTRRRMVLGTGAVAASLAAAAVLGPQLLTTTPTGPVASEVSPAASSSTTAALPKNVAVRAGGLPASLRLNPRRDEMVLVPGADDSTGMVVNARCRLEQRIVDPVGLPSVAVRLSCPGEPDLFGVSAGRGGQAATALARAEEGVTWESFLAEAPRYLELARAERTDAP